MLSPKGLHHPVKLTDMEIPAVGKPAAPVAFPASTAEGTARMTRPFTPSWYVLDALVGDFELVFCKVIDFVDDLVENVLLKYPI